MALSMLIPCTLNSGVVSKTGTSWPTIVNATVANTASSMQSVSIKRSAVSSPQLELGRALLNFNTSVIPAGAIVVGARIELTVTAASGGAGGGAGAYCGITFWKTSQPQGPGIVGIQITDYNKAFWSYPLIDVGGGSGYNLNAGLMNVPFYNPALFTDLQNLNDFTVAMVLLNEASVPASGTQEILTFDLFTLANAGLVNLVVYYNYPYKVNSINPSLIKNVNGQTASHAVGFTGPTPVGIGKVNGV